MAFGFPFITIKDMVNAQRHLVDHLGIDRLLAVAGGSMGGMQALQWIVSYPDRVRSVIPIATTATHSPQQIAFNEVGRQAIMADPNWNEGNTMARTSLQRAWRGPYGRPYHLHERRFHEREVRQAIKGTSGPSSSAPNLRSRDISSTGATISSSASIPTPISTSQRRSIILTSPMARGFRKYSKEYSAFSRHAFKSDWLYPAYQSQEIARACKLAGIDAIYCELNSTYGHDAFLVEVDEQAHLIKNFLKRVAGNLKVINEHSV